MKNFTFKRIFACAATLAAALTATTTLAACAQPQPTVTFDSPRPWHDVDASYERLEYATSIYSTTAGTDADKRVKIADGVTTFTLTENSRVDGTVSYTEIDMSFSVTYNDSASEKDKGKTDTIESTVEFQTDSLVTSRMTKKVSIADREGAENRSYVLEADYFAHTATLTGTGVDPQTTETLEIGNSTYYDNEMMFYLARAVAIGAGTSATFPMTNIYQSFDNGKFGTYTMLASGDAELVSLNIGDFVKDFGVEAATADDGTVTYPVSCYRVNILINADKHGPPYVVDYSEKPFKSGEKEHKKIPVCISYSEYSGNNPLRLTEYTLTGISFDKPAA